MHRNMKGITPEDLLKAHQADLDVQDQENADFKKAWGDPETGIVSVSRRLRARRPSCARTSVPATPPTRSARSPRRPKHEPEPVLVDQARDAVEVELQSVARTDRR